MTRWTGAFGPEAVKAMAQAFDEAWAEIGGNFGRPSEVETARLRLADAILSITTEGSTDAAQLKAGALQAMVQYYRARIRPAA
jgi:hypothetical protein